MAVGLRVTLRGQGQRAFTKFSADVRLALQRQLLAEAPLLEAELRFVLSPDWGPRTGRVYNRTGRSDLRGASIHRASAPGEPPAYDTGDLYRSVSSNKRNVRGRRVKYLQTGVTAKYGRALEEGTDRMDPRPFLERAAKPLDGLAARYGKRIGF